MAMFMEIWDVDQLSSQSILPESSPIQVDNCFSIVHSVQKKWSRSCVAHDPTILIRPSSTGAITRVQSTAQSASFRQSHTLDLMPAL